MWWVASGAGYDGDNSNDDSATASMKLAGLSLRGSEGWSAEASMAGV